MSTVEATISLPFSSSGMHDSAAGNDTDHADGILNVIGNTPLVRFRKYIDVADVQLFVKLEAMNPGGSAKDRPARQMLVHAIETGLVHSGSTIIESSSGNMGIGLAQACRYFNLPFVCVVDPHAQPLNLAIMQALGASIERVTQPVNGSFLSARLARVCRLLETTPDSFWPNQYANHENPASHQMGTIREIDQAMNGEIDFLFVATSSTGTAQGCRNYLRQRGRSTRVIAVDAVGSVLFGGTAGPRWIPGLGAGREPELARHQTFDNVRRVTDLDCVVGCRRAAEREATLVGGSAGGVLEVVRSMQYELAGRRCVAILHDSGTRYLDTVFDDHWVTSTLNVSLEDIVARVREQSCPAQAAMNL